MTPIHAVACNRHLPAFGRPRTVRAMPNPGLDEPMSRCTVALVVNGRPIEADVPVWSTLAELLRDRLQLIGTKVACNQAACGACTVHIDASSALSGFGMARTVRGGPDAGK